MKIIVLIQLAILTGAMVLGITNTVSAQDHSKALAAADTSRFSPNKKDGWQLYNSYVSGYQRDSAQLELILQHANNFDWKKEQFVGKITYQPLHPKNGQSLNFYLLSNQFLLRIDENGKCYLRFQNGALPSEDPAIIPLKVFYKL
jgi:hypothetical protein